MPQSQDPRGTCVNDEYAELNTVTMPLKALGELRAPPVIGDVVGDQNPCEIAASHLVVMPRYCCWLPSRYPSTMRACTSTALLQVILYLKTGWVNCVSMRRS